jgi:hypothetical protein
MTLEPRDTSRDAAAAPAIIGGEHWLAPAAAAEHSMQAMLQAAVGEASFFATGRDALFTLLKSLPHTRIHLPDLLCESVYRACRQAGKEVVTYEVGPALSPREWRGAAPQPGSCILVMHYFGTCSGFLLQHARSLGLTVISDATHLVFNAAALREAFIGSDHTVASLRKSAPFPDGGFAASRDHGAVRPSEPVREEFVALRAAGLLSRGFSARGGFSDDENFVLLKKAEALIDEVPVGAHACSYLTRELLHTIDVAREATHARSNIALLQSLLRGVCTTINTRRNPSPYFLCLFRSREERDRVRSALASSRCYCPVHWDTRHLPQPSPLSDLCLSIPCDARYGDAQMRRIAGVIVSCVKP